MISVTPRRSMICGAGAAYDAKIRRCCRAQQNGRHAVFRGVLRSRVATDADTLLPAANPEPAVLLADNGSLFVQQCKADRLVGRCLRSEERRGGEEGRTRWSPDDL